MQSWAPAFFRLRACAFALLGEALRACSLLDFSRFSVFRAFFALVHLRFLIFAPVISCSYVYRRLGQDSQDNTPRTDRQNRTGRSGQPEQDRQNRTARTGQAEQDCLDRRARTGQQGHESQERTGRNMMGRTERTDIIGQAKQDSRNSSVAEPKLFDSAPAPAPALTFKKFLLQLPLRLRLRPELCGYLFSQLLNEKVDFS